MCIKILSDITTGLSPAQLKDQTLVEGKIDKYCSAKGLGEKETKVCYFFDPIKRSISTPLGNGLPVAAVCKRLKENNPELCSVKYGTCSFRRTA